MGARWGVIAARLAKWFPSSTVYAVDKCFVCLKFILYIRSKILRVGVINNSDLENLISIYNTIYGKELGVSTNDSALLSMIFGILRHLKMKITLRRNLERFMLIRFKHQGLLLDPLFRGLTSIEELLSS